MAAAYRSGMKEPKGSKLSDAREDIALEWELACRKIMGKKAYERSRQERYEKLINQMRKESADVSS